MGPCWTSFASHHNTGYQSTHQTQVRQRPFNDDASRDVVAYLEYKHDEVKAEYAAQQDHHSDNESSESEAVKDVPCFDDLNGISGFHDFQYEVWEEVCHLVGSGGLEHTKKQKANVQK
jgi:hypothetical protein